MSLRSQDSGTAEGRRRLLSAQRLWSRAVDGLAALGTIMILLLMVMIGSDVFARNITGGSLPLISELGALTLVMIVYLQLGTTIRNNRLARTDFFLDALEGWKPRAAALVSGLWDLFGIAVCAGIAWSTYGILLGDIEHHEFIGVTAGVTLPTWPFRALILVGSAVAAAQFVVQAVRSLMKAVGAGKHTS
ncbi:TRAP transporter small permease subunit [Chelativorans alearense]|uniref:TRAP transporter small permease subunit n=1 Tax=Chelativorans alearense TaxID=2681495 RepID=UPI0013D1EB20|nr:TRAP transporter small permease [Chelativorans alearense]